MASSNGFGKIHELTGLERDIRNELAVIAERIYLAMNLIEEPDFRGLINTPDGVEKYATIRGALDNAMTAVKRLNGD